ncbi:MAG: TolC family protein [Bacteroidales bacterium]
MELSLVSAINHAVEHNKNLKNAGLSIDESNQRLRETIAQGLPQLNATIDYSNFFGSKATLGPGFEIEFTPTSNLGISASQLIFNGSYIVGIQMSKLHREMMETNYLRSELELKADVTQFYLLNLMTLNSKEILESNLANMNDLLSKTRSLVEVGIAEELDYDQLQVQVAILQDNKRALERQVEMALNMLRLQIGVSSEVDILLTDSFESILSDSNMDQSLATVFNLQNNIDYHQLSLQTTLAQKQVNMERAAHLPTVSGFYSFTEKLIKPEFDLTPPHIIGLNMSIPIFSSGARYSRVQQAKINLDIATNQEDFVSQQLMIHENQLRFNMINALEQYESQKANLEVARRVFNSINNKFTQGTVSSLDLTTSNSNYLQAENSYLSSVFNLLEAHLSLKKLLNTL